MFRSRCGDKRLTADGALPEDRASATNQMKMIRDSIRPRTFAGGIERMTPLHPRRIRMPDCMDRGKNNKLSVAALSVY